MPQCVVVFLKILKHKIVTNREVFWLGSVACERKVARKKGQQGEKSRDEGMFLGVIMCLRAQKHFR